MNLQHAQFTRHGGQPLSHPTASTVGRPRVDLAKSADLPFDRLLTSEQLDQATSDEKHFFRIEFTPRR